MAIEASAKNMSQMDRRFANIAGAVALVGGVALAVVSILVMAGVFGHDRLQQWFEQADFPSWSAQAMELLSLVLAVIIAAGGFYMLRGRRWAHRLESALAVVVTLASVSVLLSVIMRIITGGAETKAMLWPAALASVILFVVFGAWTYLLFLASAPESRLRYGTQAILSIALAVALAVIVNIIAQADYWRKDFQTLGRFGVSERTKRILSQVDQPLRLTCVYTSDDPEYKTDQRRSRVLDLLREMSEYGRDVEVDNITTDAGKFELIGRLRKSVRSQAGQHVKFVENFRKQIKTVVKNLQNRLQEWSQLPADSYLNRWGLSAEISGELKDRVNELQSVLEDMREQAEMTSLPDYADLVQKATDALTATREELQKQSELLHKIANVPEKVKANRGRAVEAMDAAVAAMNKLVEVTGAPDSAPPEKPEALLKKISEQMGRVVEKISNAAEALRTIAGEGSAELLRQSRAWTMQVQAAGGLMSVRITIDEYFSQYAELMRSRQSDVESLLEVARPKYQIQAIKDMRKSFAENSGKFAQIRDKAAQRIGQLINVDSVSEEVLARAEGGNYFAAQMKPVDELLEQADELPELEDGTLAEDITGDNIVVVETEDDIRTVGFDEVWPVEGGAFGRNEDKTQNRTFNGNAAIGSAILSMTQEPFAKVMLTYYSPTGRQARRMPQPDISVYDLSTLRSRLEQANFEVVEWNLSEEMPGAGDEDESDESQTQPSTAPSEEEEAPRVMLVLPPPPAMPGMPPGAGFGKEHIEKINKGIDSGIPSIFLAGFTWPRQMGFGSPPVQLPYGLDGYLRKEWGIDARTNYRVVMASPDEQRPGMYRLNLEWFYYMPISAFTDHPIGEPLQARRMLWNDLCPVVPSDNAPENVELEPLLKVPAAYSGNTWATNDIRSLIESVMEGQGSTFSPDYEGGDTRPPFAVAMAAVREGDNPARIVVLGCGASLTDTHLDQPAIRFDSGGNLARTDPPGGNAEVVINSVYWLIGRQRYIASGPAQIRPIEMIDSGTQNALQVACLLGLPLIVLAVGGLVMFFRRK